MILGTTDAQFQLEETTQSRIGVSDENHIGIDIDKSMTEIENSVEVIDIPMDQLKITTNGCDTYPRDQDEEEGISYISYESEIQMPSIMKLIQKDLSEPYSIYTYRYFIHNWPKLCFLAMDMERVVGAIVCKLDVHKQSNKRGYIAMLAVDEKYRRKKIGKN